MRALLPLTRASPAEGRVSPVSILKVVVLPAPFTPSSPKHSPFRTPKVSLVVYIDEVLTIISSHLI